MLCLKSIKAFVLTLDYFLDQFQDFRVHILYTHKHSRTLSSRHPILAYCRCLVKPSEDHSLETAKASEKKKNHHFNAFDTCIHIYVFLRF